MGKIEVIIPSTETDWLEMMRLEAMGFEPLLSNPDPKYHRFNAPDGWTASTLLSNGVYWIKDANGRIRMSVHMDLGDQFRGVLINRRYTFSVGKIDAHPESGDSLPWKGVVYDGLHPIWSTGLIEAEPPNSTKTGISSNWFYWNLGRDKLHNQCEKYLNEHFPNWRDPLAYW